MTFKEKSCKSATFCQEQFDIFLAWFSQNIFVTTLKGFMHFSVMLSFSSFQQTFLGKESVTKPQGCLCGRLGSVIKITQKRILPQQNIHSKYV